MRYKTVKTEDKIQLVILTMTVESDEELNMNRPDGETMMQLMLPTCPVHCSMYFLVTASYMCMF